MDYRRFSRKLDSLVESLERSSVSDLETRIGIVIDGAAHFYSLTTGKEVPSERREVVKEGILLFLKHYERHYRGRSGQEQALQVVKDILSNRALIAELLSSNDPADLTYQKLLAHMARGGRVGYDPVGVSGQVRVLSSKADLEVLPGASGIRMIKDVGLAGHLNRAVDAGETIEIKIGLKNASNDTYYRSTSVFLESDDPHIAVENREVVYCERKVETGETVTFAPGQSVPDPSGNFVFSISPACPDGHKARLSLVVWDTDLFPYKADADPKTLYGGRNIIELELVVYNVGPLTFGKARVDDDMPGPSEGNGNGKIEAGEIIEYVLGMKNEGRPTVERVRATLSSPLDFVLFDVHPGGNVLHYREVIGGTASREIKAAYIFEISEDTRGVQDLVLNLLVEGRCRGFPYRWLRSAIERSWISDEEAERLIQEAFIDLRYSRWKDAMDKAEKVASHAHPRFRDRARSILEKALVIAGTQATEKLRAERSRRANEIASARVGDLKRGRSSPGSSSVREEAKELYLGAWGGPAAKELEEIAWPEQGGR